MRVSVSGDVVNESVNVGVVNLVGDQSNVVINETSSSFLYDFGLRVMMCVTNQRLIRLRDIQ